MAGAPHLLLLLRGFLTNCNRLDEVVVLGAPVQLGLTSSKRSELCVCIEDFLRKFEEQGLAVRRQNARFRGGFERLCHRRLCKRVECTCAPRGALARCTRGTAGAAALGFGKRVGVADLGLRCCDQRLRPNMRARKLMRFGSFSSRGSAAAFTATSCGLSALWWLRPKMIRGASGFAARHALIRSATFFACAASRI
eukprot:389444-Prymnesium_polylepis.1